MKLTIQIDNQEVCDNFHELIDNVWFHSVNQLITALLYEELAKRKIVDSNNQILENLYESHKHTKHVRKLKAYKLTDL